MRKTSTKGTFTKGTLTKGGTLSNDLFHGDIVGTVKQSDSGAKVMVSQIAAVDSAIIDPATGNFGIYDLRIGNYDLTILAENYRTYMHKNVMVNPGGVTYLGEIDLSTVPDLVSEHYPEDKDEMVYSSRWQRLNISILFIREMDRESESATQPHKPSILKDFDLPLGGNEPHRGGVSQSQRCPDDFTQLAVANSLDADHIAQGRGGKNWHLVTLGCVEDGEGIGQGSIRTGKYRNVPSLAEWPKACSHHSGDSISSFA